MNSQRDLQELLHRIDRRGYPAYKDTKGAYAFQGYVLSIDHVQGDPFAAPSKVSIHIGGKEAGFPRALFDTREKRIALQDDLLRQFSRLSAEYSFRARGSGKSGLLSVSRPGQEILERSACQINEADGSLILRMEIGFPANGRTVNAGELEKIFFDFLPKCVEKTLYYRAHKPERLQKVADLAEDQQYIREQLKEQGLVAFVANGAILPRETGVSKLPMKGAVPFVSPASMEVAMELPHAGIIKGMGIRKGITLIVGGGYHGKSTLLKAIELGVYNHISGDGREYVLTEDSAAKIRAEDGRSIQCVDISMFINNLPNGRDTTCFATEDASGSTSQAANVIEAMEAGAGTLLIDEDTSATNFMIRDELMQRVVHRDSEPITPFVDRIRELYERFGVSTILVAGSSGSYFHKADAILQMDAYQPRDVTAAAKAEAANYPLAAEKALECAAPNHKRIIKPVRLEEGQKGKGGDRVKIKTTGCDTVTINRENIDMRYVEQLVDAEQMAALGYLLTYAIRTFVDGKKTITQIVDALEETVRKNGLASVCPGSYLPASLSLPRRQEIFSCFNRWRRLRVTLN